MCSKSGTRKGTIEIDGNKLNAFQTKPFSIQFDWMFLLECAETQSSFWLRFCCCCCRSMSNDRISESGNFILFFCLASGTRHLVVWFTLSPMCWHRPDYFFSLANLRTSIAAPCVCVWVSELVNVCICRIISMRLNVFEPCHITFLRKHFFSPPHSDKTRVPDSIGYKCVVWMDGGEWEMATRSEFCWLDVSLCQLCSFDTYFIHTHTSTSRTGQCRANSISYARTDGLRR